MTIGASSLVPVMLIIIESGAIYCATLTALLATYLAQSWVQYVLVDSVREAISTIDGAKSDCYVSPRFLVSWYVLGRGAREQHTTHPPMSRGSFSAWSSFGSVWVCQRQMGGRLGQRRSSPFRFLRARCCPPTTSLKSREKGNPPTDILRCILRDHRTMILLCRRWSAQQTARTEALPIQ